MTNTRQELVDALARDWPSQWATELEPEIQTFLAGLPASLPARKETKVWWATTAPDERSLRFAAEDIRAWLVPTFAVDHGVHTVGSARGNYGTQLLKASPAGYLAWTCREDQVKTVFSKLTTLRTLLGNRPAQASIRVGSLLEMRHRFQAALIGGDHAVAKEIVDGLDSSGCETAANILFMRVKMWEIFREHAEILVPERIRRLSRIPLPSEIRAAIVRAHYWEMLAPQNEMGERPQIYADQIEPHIGSIVAQCRPEDGEEILECIAYHASCRNDSSLARELLGHTREPFLSELLSGVVDSEASTEDPPPEPPPESQTDAILPAAATWDELCDALTNGNWAAAESFLKSDDRPSLAVERATTCRRVVNSLLEILTSPDMASEASDVVPTATLAAVNDIRFDIGFPRSDLAHLYRSFLELWQAMHAGSGNSEDRAVFLILLDASLQVDPGAITQALDAIQSWWSERSSRSADDFLIECLATMNEYSEDLDTLRGLWHSGINRARSRGPLRSSARRHWLSLAGDLGIETAEVPELATDPAGSPDDDKDPLASCPFKRIAIVSGKETPARRAAEQIEARSDAKVFVVSSSVANEATDRARNADCVLLVWSAISHAAFRAFDGVREKIVYVQGTGHQSITMALERHLE